MAVAYISSIVSLLTWDMYEHVSLVCRDAWDVMRPIISLISTHRDILKRDYPYALQHAKVTPDRYPELLYQCRKDGREKLRCLVHHVSLKDMFPGGRGRETLDIYDYTTLAPGDMITTMEYLREKHSDLTLIDGDVVMVDEILGPCGSGILVIYGGELRNLDVDDVTGCGELPLFLCSISEFPPKYWSDVLSYNENAYVIDDIVKMLVKNIQYSIPPFITEYTMNKLDMRDEWKPIDCKCIWSYIEHGGERYYTLVYNDMWGSIIPTLVGYHEGMPNEASERDVRDVTRLLKKELTTDYLEHEHEDAPEKSRLYTFRLTDSDNNFKVVDSERTLIWGYWEERRESDGDHPKGPLTTSESDEESDGEREWSDQPPITWIVRLFGGMLDELSDEDEDTPHDR